MIMMMNSNFIVPVALHLTACNMLAVLPGERERIIVFDCQNYRTDEKKYRRYVYQKGTAPKISFKDAIFV